MVNPVPNKPSKYSFDLSYMLRIFNMKLFLKNFFIRIKINKSIGANMAVLLKVQSVKK